MLSNEFYDNNAKDLIRMVNQVETDLLVDICKAIGKNDKLFKTIEGSNEKILNWRLERLAELDGLNRKNIKTIARYSKRQSKEIEKILNNAVNTILSQREGQFTKAVELGIIEAAPSLKDSEQIRLTVQNMTEFTKDNFNRMNNTMLANATSNYRNIINSASASMIAGNKTGFQAVRHLVNNLANQGITSFVDAGNRRWTAEGYSHMIIRSNTKELAVQSTIARNNEYGNTFVEISSHSNARPMCALDQGKIFDTNNTSGTIKDGLGNLIIYYSWADSTFGRPAGILGINCTHQMYPFIPEISSKTFETSKQIGQEKIKKKFAIRQEQRKIERNIRRYKRKKEMFKNVGDDVMVANSNMKIREWQGKARDHVKKHNLVRNRNREQIIIVK